jgi:hypothetical protein
MNVRQFKEALDQYDDDLEVDFLKGDSLKPLGVWDSHEWFVYEKKYLESRRNQKILAILIDD